MLDGNRIRNLVLVPAIITLAVTLLRLAGELLEWSPTFFSAEAGGGGAIVGIAWLVPVFGIYFARKLAAAGEVSVGPGRVILVSLLALVVAMALGVVSLSLFAPGSVASLIFFSALCVVALCVVKFGWPELFKVLVAYALAARIPVVIIMFLAIRGNWGTHYDAPPPNLPAMGWFSEWFISGLIPQLTFWIAFTAIFGGIFGGITLFFRRQPKGADA
jgi:hypothetical protein